MARRNGRLVLLAVMMVAGAASAAGQHETPARQPGMPSRRPEERRVFKVSGEIRFRWEGRTGIGFREDERDQYLLSRLRLNLDIRPAAWLRFFAQGQDSRIAGSEPGAVNSGVRNVFDLRQAYLQLGHTGPSGWTLFLGRQELNYGAQRLVGASNWGNTARTFDAARVVFARNGNTLDVFAASVVRIDMTRFDKHRDGENLHGAAGVVKTLVAGMTIEPYVFWKTAPSVRSETGISGNADIVTAGTRLSGKRGPADYAAELAIQRGHSSAADVAAWAGYGSAGYTLARRWKPRFWAEYAYATGDAGPGDGRAGTFDQLYPTNHGPYGIVDVIGWRNIKNLRTALDLVPWSAAKVGVEYHRFWLANGRDGLYNSGGNLIVRPPAGGARHLDAGSEIDGILSYALDSHLSLGAGIGIFFPGRFIKEQSAGRRSTFSYGMVTWSF